MVFSLISQLIIRGWTTNMTSVLELTNSKLGSVKRKIEEINLITAGGNGTIYLESLLRAILFQVDEISSTISKYVENIKTGRREKRKRHHKNISDKKFIIRQMCKL